eukprot:GHVR01008513.1.p1 GENE.GHVR01008513.1~~GHVR01008513.1.p1  ORF type:complete len:186 (-),score=37.54 GHVR01008513.1:183-740(-)
MTNKKAAEELVRLQNHLRVSAGLQSLETNDALESYISRYLSRGPSCRGSLRHSPQSMRKRVGGFVRVGENLWKGNWTPNPHDIASDWFNELYCYRYGPLGSPCISNCGKMCKSKSGRAGCQQGHFTQIMWETLTHVGCAVNKCGGAWLAGCVYGSDKGIGGNWLGRMPFSPRIAKNLGLSTKSCA